MKARPSSRKKTKPAVGHVRLWVDGGGTRVRFWMERGARSLRSRERPSTDDLVKATRAYLRGTPKPADAVFGLRGVWTNGERRSWQRRLSFAARRVRVMSDIELAFERWANGGPGLLLNAGTGSIAFGRNAAGHTARSGGLGPLVGDDGSGFWMGRAFIRAAAGNPDNFPEIRALVTAPDAVRRVAALAPRVMQEAERGKADGQRIVHEAASRLVTLLADLQTQLGQPDLPIAITGSLFQNRFFLDAFLYRLRAARLPGLAAKPVVL
jgi:N-acetylglucosamine kinase-like BadF-type ATPase